MNDNEHSGKFARVLNCPMGPNDAGVPTVGRYLCELLCTLWREEEGFSSKRPFGNSGWAYDVYGPLAENGIVEGTKDEWGGWTVDINAADDLICAAVVAAFGGTELESVLTPYDQPNSISP